MHSAVQRLLAKLLVVGKSYCRLDMLSYKVKNHHAASGCSTHLPGQEGWCGRAKWVGRTGQNAPKFSFNLQNSKPCSG
jgi:hypothetical protein